MTLIDEFLATPNKAYFLISTPVLSTRFYDDLSLLKSDKRSEIAKFLVDTHNQYDFEALIIRLTDLCFEAKGALFIRGGSADFLADILLEYFKQIQTDDNSFLKKTNLDGDEYPKDYTFPEEAQRILFIIKTIAERYAESTTDPQYISNLPQNLANKIFNPLLLKGEVYDLMKIAQFNSKVTQVRNPEETPVTNPKLIAYFDEKIPVNGDRLKITTYYNSKKTPKNLQEMQAVVEQLKNTIKTTRWKLGGIPVFFKGGVDVKIDGRNYRVPRHVAKIVELINTSTDLSKCYEDILKVAEDAIKKSSFSRDASTNLFYQDLVNSREETLFTSEAQRAQGVQEQAKLR